MLAWLKKTFSESADASASRQLMAVLVVVVCGGLLVDVRARGITVPWATVATGLAASLAGVWWRGKSPKDPTKGE